MRTRTRLAPLAVVALSLALVPLRAARAGGTVDGELTLNGQRDPGADVGVAASALFGDYGAAAYLRVTASGKVVDVKLWHPAAKDGEYLEAPADTLVVERLRVVQGAVEVKLATPGPRTTAGHGWTLTLDARASILR
jgi:hypothetical protein